MDICFCNLIVDVNNVSMIPTDNPLTIREGTRREVRCVVNSNAVPVPIISWYLDSKDITSRAGTDTTSIIITGNRTDNTKMIECRATNNNKFPKTASTILNIECKFGYLTTFFRYGKHRRRNWPCFEYHLIFITCSLIRYWRF